MQQRVVISCVQKITNRSFVVVPIHMGEGGGGKGAEEKSDRGGSDEEVKGGERGD